MGMKYLVWTLPALLVAGCSGFERDWKAAVAAPASDPLTGAWQGTWRSQATGHSGGLRSIVTALPDGSYRARYKATYFCCFTFQYQVPMEVVREGDTDRFHGTADLGFFAGGEYHYGGEATAGRFNCTYRANSDQGVFELEKVSAAARVPR